MRLIGLKNTVLLLVFLCLSCGNDSNSNSAISSENLSAILTQKAENKGLPIIVGANQTELYLPLLRNKRVGIVANQTSVIQTIPIDTNGHQSANVYRHLVDSLLAHYIDIKKVFSPEHGFRGKADAGELVKDGVDTKTGLSIYSLHGKHKKPTEEQLDDLDVVIFDIQDVGVRFYTYISTLHYVMEACAEQNIPLLILDRPNPNGNYIDGPVLKSAHRSFLGMHPIPLVHGMTIGEYAQMINGEKWLKNGIACDITIIQLKNYNHQRSYNLPIRPSPNLPNNQSITLYPSLGLFEGTNINAGRGTEFQFQRYGAPFLDSLKYQFRYKPEPNFGAKYPKHNGEICFGIDLSQKVITRQFTLDYVIDAYTNATDKSKFFNTSNFTKHAGNEVLQKQIEAGLPEKQIRESWSKDISTFKDIRQKYLLYE